MKSNEFGRILVATMPVVLTIGGLAAFSFQLGRRCGKTEVACELIPKFTELEISLKEADKASYEKTQTMLDEIFSFLLSRIK